MFQAIVFDFDGTILDTETVWYESYREASARQGADLPFEVFANVIGTSSESMFLYLRERLGSDDAVDAVKQAATALHHGRVDALQPREGVLDYFKEARRLGLRIGLATSSPLHWVQPFLRSFGLLDSFDAICTSDDVEKVKPDPALYRLACERLGVAPERAVAIEDSANGARSAVAAGLRCVIVPNPVTATLAFDRYDLRLSSFEEQTLGGVLRRLEGNPSDRE